MMKGMMAMARASNREKANIIKEIEGHNPFENRSLLHDELGGAPAFGYNLTSCKR